MKGISNRATRSPGAGLDPKLQPLVENLEILNGARGSGLDRALTVRDLNDLGIISVKRGSGGKVTPVPPTNGGNGGGTGGTTPPTPGVEFPTKPLNVTAAGGFSNILVEWDTPTYKGHAYAEIYRSSTDDFSTASKVGQTAANLYSDTVGDNVGYYYWVRFFNVNNDKGPLQSTNGVFGKTSGAIGDILDQLKGQIDESFLTPEFDKYLEDIELQTKKNEDGIFTIEGDIVDLNESTTHLSAEADLLAEAAMNAATGVDKEGNQRRKITAEIKETQKTIITEQGAMAQQILSIKVEVDGNSAAIKETKTAIITLDEKTGKAIEAVTQRLDEQKSEIDDNTASITTNAQTIVKVGDDVTSLASQVNTVESDLNGTKATVSQHSSTIAHMDANGTSAYEAQWGVKASIGDIQAGIGLTVKKNPDGTKVSQCTIIADQFSVGSKARPGETIYPFIVARHPETGDYGVFIDTAYIKAATVQELVAGEVIADTVKASASISAPRIKGGTIEIGSRFSVDENGNAVMNNMEAHNSTIWGGLNVTRSILGGGNGGSPQGRAFEVNSAGYLYAEEGHFGGTVRADKILSDVTAASSFKFRYIDIASTSYTDYNLIYIEIVDSVPYNRTCRLDNSIRMLNKSRDTETVGEAYIRDPSGNLIQRFISHTYDPGLSYGESISILPAGFTFNIPPNTKGTYKLGWNVGGSTPANLRFTAAPQGSREDRTYDISVSIFKSGTSIVGSQA